MKLVLSLSAFVVFTLGCSGGKSGDNGAAWCTSDYKVSSFKLDNAKSKTELTDDTEVTLEAGKYYLKELDVYFVDTQRDLRAHMAFILNEKGETQERSVRCVGTDSGQIAVDMEEYLYDINVFSFMEVDPSGKTSFADGLATIEFKYRGEESPLLDGDFVILDGKPVQKKLKDTFKNGYTKTEQVLFSLDQAYELQNKLTESPSLRVETRQLWRRF